MNRWKRSVVFHLAKRIVRFNLFSVGGIESIPTIIHLKSNSDELSTPPESLVFKFLRDFLSPADCIRVFTLRIQVTGGLVESGFRALDAVFRLRKLIEVHRNHALSTLPWRRLFWSLISRFVYEWLSFFFFFSRTRSLMKERNRSEMFFLLQTAARISFEISAAGDEAETFSPAVLGFFRRIGGKVRRVHMQMANVRRRKMGTKESGKITLRSG